MDLRSFKKKFALADIYLEKKYVLHKCKLEGHLLEPGKKEQGHVFPRGGEAQSWDRSQHSLHLLLLSGGQLKNLCVLSFKSEPNQHNNLSLQIEVKYSKWQTNKYGKSTTERKTRILYDDRIIL